MLGKDGRVVLALALFAWLTIALATHRPPSVVPESAVATAFSAERAMAHVRVLAAEPRPTGSPANAAARAYLVGTLAKLGVAARVLEAPSPRAPGKALHNVVATLRGAPGGEPVLLVAHYDSVAAGPGAGDNAAGVAALLEAARALRAAPPLARDVVLLFTDGEELGLLGAKAFAQAELEKLAPTLVVNLDARGVRGPAFMFETIGESAWLASELARAAPDPFATSLTGEVYERMPNDTDFTVFRAASDAGKPKLRGYNFAFIDGVAHYHAPTDTPAMLDPRTLQNEGDAALGLARHFGDKHEAAETPGAGVWFDVVGSVLVSYPIRYALPIAIAALTVAGVALVRALLDRAIRATRVVVAALLAVAAIVFGAGATRGLWSLVVAVVKPQGMREFVTLATSPPLVALALALAAFVALACFASVGPARKVHVVERHAAVALTFSVLAVAAALVAPAASHLVAFPALGASIAFALVVQVAPREGDLRRPSAAVDVAHALLVALAAAPTLFLWPPTLSGLVSAFTLDGAAILGGATAMVVVLATPALELVLGARRAAIVAASGEGD